MLLVRVHPEEPKGKDVKWCLPSCPARCRHKGAFTFMESVANNTPATLKGELDEFIIDRQARNLSPRTVQWYTHSLNIWAEYIIGLGIHATQAVNPTSLRRFLLFLNERGHNPGG